jgi:hypothetical protein
MTTSEAGGWWRRTLLLAVLVAALAIGTVLVLGADADGTSFMYSFY